MIENKNIVLTGAGSGIGLETLKILMQGKGNNILAVDKKIDRIKDFPMTVCPFQCDVSTKEGVESIFSKAEEVFAGKKIDIFIANAGFAYYEKYDYKDWDRVERIMNTNAVSPIYTYAMYLKHLNGRKGQLAYTVSAIGQMAMPGYALYSSSKFALQGFQQAIRLEKPKNLTMTCLYPVATATNFFKTANPRKFKKPFPIQDAKVVAERYVEGIEKKSKYIYPSRLYVFSRVLFTIFPIDRTLYWRIERWKLESFLKEGK